MIEKKYGLGIRNDLDIDFESIKKENHLIIKISKQSEGYFEKSEEYFKTQIKLNDELEKMLENKSKKITITIPKDSNCKIYVETKNQKKDTLCLFHLRIVAENDSECFIHNNISGTGKLVSGFTEIICKKNAKVEFLESVNLNKDSIYYSKKISNTDTNGKVFFFQADLSAKKIYNNIKSSLNEKHSESKINHLFLTNEFVVDAYLESHHNNESTSSNILSRGVLKNTESYIRGLVKIKENAFNSDGYQKSEVLLLDDSKAISIPDLEIHNNEVKCSHGSTITKLSDEKLFYMQSRGLSSEQAEKELIEGFFQPILINLNNNRAKNLINKKIKMFRS